MEQKNNSDNDAIKSFAEAIRFHGHVCPGLTMGYRVAKRAMEELCTERAEDEELVTIVENDSCAVDGIQIVTGCTMGKGNLIFRNYGKHAYTIINRRTEQAVRIVINPDFSSDTMNPEFSELREKINTTSGSEQDTDTYRELIEKVSLSIMEIPDESIFEVRHVEAEIPERARLFNSVTCASCGEKVAESRARVQDGKIVCIPCFEHYSRGW